MRVIRCTASCGERGYLSGLSRPEQVVYFFRQVLGIPVVSKRRQGKLASVIDQIEHGHPDATACPWPPGSIQIHADL